eukprot:gb/GECH01013828.1/.p1 GENE.gb/GECH01013828.1/~~gb/GECH01013828.1/.p1  ORF type:complete len:763 (+),score=173.59 gb/GECH01013828.1/:1-2289(+)
MDIDFGLRFGALIHQTTTPSLPQLELPLSHNLNIVEAFFYPPNAYSHYDSVSIDLASEVYQDHAKYPANHIRTLELFENDAHLYVVFKYKTTIVSRIVIPQDSVNKVFREGKINGIPCTSLYINEHSFTCEMWTGTDWAELYSPTLDSTRYILLSDEHDLLFTYFKCEAGFFEDPESGGTVLERSPGSKAALDTGMGGSWGSDSMAHDSYNDSDDPSLWEDDPYHSQHNHFSDSDDGFSRLERSLNHDTWDFPSPLSEYSGSSFSSFNLTHNHHHHHNLTTTTSTTKTSNTSPNIGSEPSTSKSFTSRSSTNPTPTSTPNPNSTNQNRLRVVFNKFRGHVRGEGSHDEDHPPHPSESASTATASAVSASALGISLDQIKHSSAMTTHATTPTTTSTTKLSSSSSSSSPLPPVASKQKEKEKDPLTTLFKAIASGDWYTAQDILSDANNNITLNTKNRKGFTALHQAVVSNQEAIVRRLLDLGAVADARDRLEGTPLHWACANNLINIASVLCSRGQDIVNLRDFYGYAPFHLALKNRNMELAETLLLFDKSTLNLKSTADGSTAFHVAAQLNDVDMMQFLLEKGALISCPDSRGETPMMRAIRYGADDAVMMIIQTILNPSSISSRRSNILAQNEHGENALHIAAELGHHRIILLLANYVPEEFQIMLSEPEGSQHLTPLHQAVVYAHRKCIQTLLRLGADPCARDGDGNTPLHLALQEHNFEDAKLLLKFINIKATKIMKIKNKKKVTPQMLCNKMNVKIW